MKAQNIIKKHILLGLAILAGALMNNSFAQTTVNFTTPGADTWTCPLGVTSIKVTVWGGGGGGGGENSNADGAGGGGGGACSVSNIAVTPLTTYNLFVGSGGAAGAAGGDGGDGTGSWFINATTVYAEGGQGGLRRDANGGEGGAGGDAANGFGDATFSGGNGANGKDANNGIGGGGGGAAGDAADGGGVAATTIHDDAAGAGGANGGGNGGAGGNTGVGGAGVAPGGGAGGAGENGNTGGAGARGQVTIYYCVTSTKTFDGSTSNDWNTAANWTPVGVPGVCDNVTIPNTFTVTTSGVGQCNSLTIQSGGQLTASNAITVNGTFTIANGGTYIHNNTTAASTTIFYGAENFGATSTIQVNAWSSGAVPLATGVSGDFGHVIFNTSSLTAWDQDGLFSPARMKGDLTINGTDQIRMDDGTGGSTSLALQNVTINAGSLWIRTGASPGTFTLTTLDLVNDGWCYMSQMTGASVINWTATGDVSTSGDFFVHDGASANVCDMTVNISGSLTSTIPIGAAFDWIYRAAGDSDLSVTVGGATSVSSNASWFHFLDAGTGDMSFTTGSLSVTSTSANFRLSESTGATTLNVGGNASFTGGGDYYILRDLSNAAATNITIGDNLTVSGGSTLWTQFGGTGVYDIDITNDFSISGGSEVFLVGDGSCFSGPSVVPCTGGAANHTTCTVGGQFSMDNNSANEFHGVWVNSNAGGFTGNFGSINQLGGSSILHTGLHSGADACTVNVTGDMNLTFNYASDNFLCINTLSTNSLASDFNVGGNVTVSGNNSAYFFTSGTTADETVDITGNLTVSGGNVWWEGNTTAGNDHNIVTNIGGNVTVSGGLLLFGGQYGTNDIDVGGNFTISGGEINVKDEDGATTLDIAGNFSQSGGTMYMHKDPLDATADVCAATVEGTFSQTNGTFNFDPNTSSTATHTLTLNGSAITLGGSGSITHSNPGTGSVFGEIYVNPTSGSTTFDRTSGSHQIDQTRIIVNAGKTMDASGSTTNMQIAAHNAADDVIPATTIMFDIFGVVNLGTIKVLGRSPDATQRPTSLVVESGAEIQTARAEGLYDGTTAASLVSLTLNRPNAFNTVNSFNWWLDANSRVTYNGTANQIVTGKYPVDFTSTTNNDVTLASTAGYHYGYLEIDHQGTIGTNYVYPVASNVFVRTQLDMDRGEFRLDGSGTGYMINIENPATTGIILTGAAGDAYIRSETNAATNPSIVRWYMETTTGAHLIPFGHSSGANNYVPFTFDVNSGGGAGSYVDVSTRATDDGIVADNKDNLPWATGVTNMWADFYNQDGATESVIDRWWQIDVSAAYDADLTFTYRAAENTLDAPNNTGNVGAQRWDGTEWLPDNSNFGSAPAAVVGTGSCTVTGITAFSPWVLSSLNAPLPVELISFEGVCEDEHLKLTWSAASEMNCDKYLIYTSENGEGFSYVSDVQAIGNSSTTLEYMYDGDLKANNYYKVSSLDFDGTEEELAIVKLEPCGISDNVINVFPNPVNEGYVNIVADLDLDGLVNVYLYDMTGKLVQTDQFDSFDEGISNVVSYDGLPKGAYLLTVENNGVRYREMIVFDK